MSELEQLVPSFDLCQQLKAAGFPQDTAMAWVNAGQGFWVGGGISVDNDGTIHQIPITPTGGYADEVRVRGEVNSLCTELCAAPTAEEILTKPPACIERGGVSYYLEVQITPAWGWDVDWTDDDGNYLQPRGEGDCKQSIVEPAALAYLWWKAQS